MPDLYNLQQKAEAVRDELEFGRNTANRVGEILVGLCETFSERLGYKHKVMTENEFNALINKDENTIYLIVEE